MARPAPREEQREHGKDEDGRVLHPAACIRDGDSQADESAAHQAQLRKPQVRLSTGGAGDRSQRFALARIAAIFRPRALVPTLLAALLASGCGASTTSKTSTST